MKNHSIKVVNILLFGGLTFLITPPALGSSLKETSLLEKTETYLTQNTSNESCTVYSNEDIETLLEERQDRSGEIEIEIELVELEEEYTYLYYEFKDLNERTDQDLDDISERAISRVLGLSNSIFLGELTGDLIKTQSSLISEDLLPEQVRTNSLRNVAIISRVGSFLSIAAFLKQLRDELNHINELEEQYDANREEIFTRRDELAERLESMQGSLPSPEDLDALDRPLRRRAELTIERIFNNAEIAELEECIAILSPETSEVEESIVVGDNPSFREVPEPQQYAGRYFSRRDDLLPTGPVSEEELNLFLNSTFSVEPYAGYNLTGPIEVNLQQGSAVIEHENTRLIFSAPAANLHRERGRYCLRTADINQDGTPDIFGTLVMLDGGKYFPHYLAVMLSSDSGENGYRSVTVGFDDIAANSLDHISHSRGVLFNTIIQCITINAGGNGVDFNIDVVPHHIVTYTIDQNRTRQQRIFYELR